METDRFCRTTGTCPLIPSGHAPAHHAQLPARGGVLRGGLRHDRLHPHRTRRAHPGPRLGHRWPPPPHPRPVAVLDGTRWHVRRTSLTEPSHRTGRRIRCADRPLWITAAEPLPRRLLPLTHPLPGPRAAHRAQARFSATALGAESGRSGRELGDLGFRGHLVQPAQGRFAEFVDQRLLPGDRLVRRRVLGGCSADTESTMPAVVRCGGCPYPVVRGRTRRGCRRENSLCRSEHDLPRTALNGPVSESWLDVSAGQSLIEATGGQGVAGSNPVVPTV